MWRWQTLAYKGLIMSRLHGQSVLLPNGHWYGLVCREIPKFNQPLYAIAHFLTQKKPNLFMVDVGAAVGDTVLFLEANFPNAFGQYLSIDGDTEYFGLQQFNLQSVQHKNTSVFALLSDREELIPAVDKKDPTTGSAVGEKREMAKTLDQVIKEKSFGPVDLLKVDIDGFDGKAIAGGIEMLARDKPIVIFEWNSPLYDMVGNDILLPFQALTQAGYQTYVWFTNKGDFSHIEQGYSIESLHLLQQVCTRLALTNGHHYDVVALHPETKISVEELIAFNESQLQKSPY